MSSLSPAQCEKRNINFSLIAFERERPTSEKPGQRYSYFFCDLSKYSISSDGCSSNPVQDYQEFLSCVPALLKGERTPSLNPDPFGRHMSPESYGAEVIRSEYGNYFPLERAVPKKIRSVGQTLVFAMSNVKSNKYASIKLKYEELNNRCVHWWAGNLEVYPEAQTYEQIFGNCSQ